MSNPYNRPGRAGAPGSTGRWIAALLLVLAACSDARGPTVPEDTGRPAAVPPGPGQESAGAAGSIAAGDGHSCALRDGVAYCWGGNFDGRLGDGSTTERLVPTRIATSERFSRISSGGGHSCAVTAAGEAFCWGRSLAAGALGNGSLERSLTPARVAGGHAFVAISAGAGATCAVTRDGAAYCWGYGVQGRLGTGQSVGSPVPARVAGDVGFVSITMGPSSSHACGLAASGEAYCWGYNGDGQLGSSGGGTHRDAPTRVAGELRFKQISAGESHTCGVTVDGRAYCWGANHQGGLGNGAQTSAATPVRVSGGHTFQEVQAGTSFSCGLTPAGRAYCWGGNNAGALGNGSSTASSVPVPVAGGHEFTTLSLGRGYACGWTRAGEALCWGSNFYGQHGNGTKTDANRPVAVAWR